MLPQSVEIISQIPHLQLNFDFAGNAHSSGGGLCRVPLGAILCGGCWASLPLSGVSLSHYPTKLFTEEKKYLQIIKKKDPV